MPLMLHDSVLRCLVPILFEGVLVDEVHDAVKEGDNYLIVLAWGSLDENAPGCSPSHAVAIPAAEIDIETDPSKHYELVSRMVIDLDSSTTTDVDSLTSREFQLPPR